MSVVTSLDFSPPGPEGGPPGHPRIRWTSRGLAALFTLLFFAYGLIVTTMLLAFLIPFAGDHLALGPKGGLIHFGESPLPPAYVAIETLPLVQRLAHVPAGMLIAAPVLVIFWSLRQLFRLYARGVVFAPENAGHLKRIGACLALHAAAPLMAHLFLNGLGMAIDQNWMHGYSLQELVLGGVVYVIAQVMQVGREIEEERSQFV
jgi:hypothetical protein